MIIFSSLFFVLCCAECTRPRLFQCGYAEMTSYVCDTVLVDMQRADSADEAQRDDLLVVGMHGPFPRCPAHFPGKVLFINGEPHGNRPHNTFMLGTAPDDEFNVQVYHGAMMAHKDPALFWSDRSPLHSAPREKFLLYVSSRCFHFRQLAFDRLSEIGPVDAGGTCVGLRQSAQKRRVVLPRFQHGENHHIYRAYRFALVMENTKMDGYITEKIIAAFAGGAIPIYYGTTEIFRVFNRLAFVFYDIDDPEPALSQIRFLEANRTALAQMQKQPIFTDGNETLKRYFSFTDDVGDGQLKHRIRRMLGIC